MNVLMVLNQPTCEGDLLGKNSKLDLRPFGVVVLAVGCMVMPWMQFCTKESMITLLVATV